MANPGNTKVRYRFENSLVEANDQLYYYALQLTENMHDAEDLVQETNLKALNNFSRLKHEKHRNAWLYTILRNTHINNLRSGHNRHIRMNKSDHELIIANALMPEYENPDSIYERKELQDNIRRLPSVYSRPLKLYLAGYAYKEIAKMNRLPIGTVKSRIHIAKQKLRKTYLGN
ncbi:RNA polymerase sigma factor [Bacteroidota bacterium]